MSLERLDLERFEAATPEWEALAAAASTPFATAAWLASWWHACAPEDGLALVLRDDNGDLLAGGCFAGRSRRHLAAATNAHSNEWEIVARDGTTAARFWTELTALGHRRLTLQPLTDVERGEGAAREALSETGFRLVGEAEEASPWLDLPDSLEALLAARSRNLRSQVARRRRALQREGELKMRVVRDGPSLERDLDAFFALEAAGWKGEGGTAIAADPALVTLYRDFARRTAGAGWLRLYMLELDGRLIAADYGCVFDSCGYLVKTAFDEELGRMAPGLVLRAEVLAASIKEGLSRYDFLGGPDPYKLRWADQLRKRSSLRAFRGAGALPGYAWRASLRPALKSARDLARRLPRTRRS